jgi:Zn-dependent protease
MHIPDYVVMALIWAFPVLIAITFHEVAHGYVAWRLGDDTAKRLGRLSLNPFRHIDLYGTVIVPALLILTVGFPFGWAKPVPVEFGRLQHPRRDMVWVAAAGPATNLALAIVSVFALYAVPLLPQMVGDWLFLVVRVFVQINLILAVFNMIPIPPLDGGRVAVGLLPMPLAIRLARLERFGFLIIIAALFLLPWLGGEIGVNLNIFPWLVGAPVDFLFRVIAGMAGF